MYQDPNQRQDLYPGYDSAPQSSNPYGTPPPQSSDPYGTPPSQSSNPYGTPPSQSSQPLQQNSYGAPAQNPYGAGYGQPAQNPYGAGYGQPAQPSQPGYYVPMPGLGPPSNYRMPGMPPNYGTLPNYGTQLNYQQQNLSSPRHWYGNGRRVFYGGLWTFYTLVLVREFVHYLSIGSFTTALFSAGLALLIGNYAYRIWTWRARHLWLIIFF